jgi:hypothetical protein
MDYFLLLFKRVLNEYKVYVLLLVTINKNK